MTSTSPRLQPAGGFNNIADDYARQPFYRAGGYPHGDSERPGGSYGRAIGIHYVLDNGAVSYWGSLYQLVPASSGGRASYALSLPSEAFWANGANQITAVYSGDSTYLPSTSNATSVSVDQGGSDFTLVAQNPQLALTSDSAGAVGVNLKSINNFKGSVALTCAPSSSQFSCSVGPASTALNGAASATLTITASLPDTTAKPSPTPTQRVGWHGDGAALAFCFLFVLPVRRREVGQHGLPAASSGRALAGRLRWWER